MEKLKQFVTISVIYTLILTVVVASLVHISGTTFQQFWKMLHMGFYISVIVAGGIGAGYFSRQPWPPKPVDNFIKNLSGENAANK